MATWNDERQQVAEAVQQFPAYFTLRQFAGVFTINAGASYVNDAGDVQLVILRDNGQDFARVYIAELADYVGDAVAPAYGPILPVSCGHTVYTPFCDECCTEAMQTCRAHLYNGNCRAEQQRRAEYAASYRAPETAPEISTTGSSSTGARESATDDATDETQSRQARLYAALYVLRAGAIDYLETLPGTSDAVAILTTAAEQAEAEYQQLAEQAEADRQQQQHGRPCDGGCGRLRSVVIQGEENKQWMCYECSSARRNEQQQTAPVVLRSGSLAYLDTFCGLIPCRVNSIRDTSAGRIASVTITGARTGYAKGTTEDRSTLHVIPRRAVVTRSGQYRILPYTVVSD